MAVEEKVFGLSVGEAYLIASGIKLALDLFKNNTGKTITIAELPEILKSEDVRRAIGAVERNETVEAFLARSG